MWPFRFQRGNEWRVTQHFAQHSVAESCRRSGECGPLGLLLRGAKGVGVELRGDVNVRVARCSRDGGEVAMGEQVRDERVRARARKAGRTLGDRAAEA